MQIRDLMSTDLLTVEREDTLREAARRMSERGVGAAIADPGTPGSSPGIVTEWDVLRSVGAGKDPDSERVADYSTPDAVSVPPDSSLEQAAETMAHGGFRHLLVADEDELVGIVAMRDIVQWWTRQRALPGWGMPIRDAMDTDVLTVGGEDTLREATWQMSEQGMGAAVVEPAKAGRPPGIITMREVLHSVGAGQDPDAERVADHLAPAMTFSAPGWSLSQAAEAMTKGGFQHIVVVDESGTVGIISMRDLVRSLTSQ